MQLVRPRAQTAQKAGIKTMRREVEIQIARSVPKENTTIKQARRLAKNVLLDTTLRKRVFQWMNAGLVLWGISIIVAVTVKAAVNVQQVNSWISFLRRTVRANPVLTAGGVPLPMGNALHVLRARQ